MRELRGAPPSTRSWRSDERNSAREALMHTCLVLTTRDCYTGRKRHGPFESPRPPDIRFGQRSAYASSRHASQALPRATKPPPFFSPRPKHDSVDRIKIHGSLSLPMRNGRGGRRPGAGRRPLTPGRPLTSALGARFTEADYAAIEKAAKRQGETVSDFIRRTVLAAVKRRP
jgi:hypothetical protein